MFDGFRLANEEGRGARRRASLLDYRVPAGEPAFDLPSEFISQGWIHVLEDSEINLLLMVACGLGTLPDPSHVAIPGDVRLLQYGIGRDSYSTAHATLEELGLLEVIPVGRHDDGQVVGYGEEGVDAHVHRLRLRTEGFERSAHPTLVDALRNLLG